MATDLRTRLVLDALDMAVTTRKPADVVQHSDQGYFLPTMTKPEPGPRTTDLYPITVHGSETTSETCDHHERAPAARIMMAPTHRRVRRG
jgi:hypothetical protein